MNSSQVITGAIVAVFSWYGMMTIHEAGHCIGAVVTGAKIDAVAIPLVGFSHTDFSGGNEPFLVVWAGPLFGATMPLALLILLKSINHLARHFVLFFTGFCLLANGLYIALGTFIHAGDSGQLHYYGSPRWQLLAFGSVCFGGGLYLWHRMGRLRGWFTANQAS